MTKKQSIRAFLFVLFTLLLIWWLDHTFRAYPSEQNIRISRRFQEMYTDKENTWDGIIVGSSNGDRAWAAPLAWEEYGMTLYPMTVDGNAFALIPNVIEEVLKRQDLSYVLVELHGLSDANIQPDPSRIRWVTDQLKRSANWLDAIDKGMDYLEKYAPETIPGGDSHMFRLSLYLPFLQFHSRVTSDELTAEDIFYGQTDMKGVFDAKWSYYTRHETLTANENTPDASEQQKELLDELFAYCEKKDLQLLFFNVKTNLDDETEESINAAASYCEEHGYSVLNLNDSICLQESGLNGDEDYYDRNHLNARGARKFTEYLSAWLQEELEIADHRQEEGYESWEEAAQNYDRWYEETLAKTIAWAKKHPDE